MNQSSVMRFREAESALWRHYGAQPRSYFLQLERPRVRVRIQELGEGPPLLFVHGGPNAGTTWAPLVARMGSFRCLVLDRPGCGLSQPVDYDATDLRSLATDVLVSVINALDIERLPLVASSMGGLWAYWLAQGHAARVSRMVQMGCPALIDDMKIPTFMRLLSIPGLNRLMTRMMPPSVDSARDLYRQIGHGASMDAAGIDDVYFNWAYHLMDDTDTMRNELGLIEKALTWRGSRSALQVGEGQLRAVSQPTLYIWGEDDPFGGEALARRTAARTSRAELQLLPHSGHLPWLDDPAGVAAKVERFLLPEAAPATGHQRVHAL